MLIPQIWRSYNLLSNLLRHRTILFWQRLHEEYQQKVVILETDLTESLDELSDALEREKDYEISLNNARRREKALLIKQRRLEETMREQDEEIKYLAETKSTLDLSQGPPCDATTQTDRLYYEERGIDTGTLKSKEIPVRSVGRSRAPKPPIDNTVDGKGGNKQPPEGVDLLNSVSIARKDQILGEARRRRTLKSKKDKQRTKTLDEMPEADQSQKVIKKKKGLFSKLLCCCSSKRSESEAYERTITSKA